METLAMKAITISLMTLLSAIYSVSAKMIETEYNFGPIKVIQFEDKALAHFSYAVIADKKVTLIDPARHTAQYFELAKKHDSKITGVIETHPHADFVSGHLEIHQQSNATIYVGDLVGASYPHKAVKHGDVIELSKNVSLEIILTPGHSPDGISIILVVDGKSVAVFTGDTLFVGDVGRPDLRESVGSITSERRALAVMMYKTIREQFMTMEDDVVVLPAHGSGSLCGKALGDAQWSTIGKEKATNPAMQSMSEEVFVKWLLEDQPFVPAYFGYDVNLNKAGAPTVNSVQSAIKYIENSSSIPQNALMIDVRPSSNFRKGHLATSINIPDGGKFETWLGSVIKPEEHFYLIAENQTQAEAMIYKMAKIGYDLLLKGVVLFNENQTITSAEFDKNAFDKNQDVYTIIDVRNVAEVGEGVFKDAVVMPLPELRNNLAKIPSNKPIVVHCASGYRSAIATSIIKAAYPEREVLDMSSAIKEYK